MCKTHSTQAPALRTTLIIATTAALATGCARDASDQNIVAPGAGYRAELVRTTHGVAHITAEDFGSLGYGEGFAAAEDHVCNIAYGLITARGERARYFGAGDDNAHLFSDAVVRALDIPGQAVTAWERQPEDIREWLSGYVAGYNRWLSEQGPSTTAWCHGAAWVQPATVEDFKARMVLLAQTLPQMPAALMAAQPPAAQDSSAEEQAVWAPAVSEQQLAAAQGALQLEGMGSNAWALGSERSENGRGMLLGNPHYPWYGGNRFWEKHLTIPGQLDVYGVHLLGAPGVSIGFNRGVGWSHTVSASQRVVFYALEMVPGEPLKYRYDGEERSLSARTVSVPVLQEDGALRDSEHTLYFSHHGPMVALPGMGWGVQTAYTARDANAGNDRLLAQWKAMNLAEDMDSFIAAHREHNAMPWVNTMAASADGRAVYLDNSTVGHLSEEAIAAWRARVDSDALTGKLYAERGMVLLDGSDSRFEWQQAEGTTVPGTVPFDERPQLERSDYIYNANDSYWLTHPDQPLEGFSPLYGPERTARSLRTRMNVQLLEAQGPHNFAGEDGRFSLQEIQRALFANQSLSAELLLAPLLDACNAQPEVTLDDKPVDLRNACAALAGFDGSMNEDSAGAILFREWLADYPYADTLRAGSLFAEDFRAEAPVATPRALGDQARALQALARAVTVLEAADLALDAPLGAAQAAYRGELRIPVHGGNRHEGVANLQISGDPAHPLAPIDATPVASSALMTRAGYPIMHGSSFILTMGFTDEGPVAQALLSYSQSGDPGSPWFSDQTELYRAKQWRDIAFTAQAVRETTVSSQVLEGPR